MDSMVSTVEREKVRVVCSACGVEFQEGVLDKDFAVEPENMDGLYRAKDGTLLHACRVDEAESEEAFT